MKVRSINILVTMGITVIGVILALFVPPNMLALRVLTLPLVFILPGYALTSALFTRQAIGIAVRFLLSLGLSLVIVILGGLALNVIPPGLSSDSWAILLGTITLAACAVALARRSELSEAAPGSFALARFGVTLRQGILLGLAVVVVSVALVLSFVGAALQPRPGFTQLWILPKAGTATVHSAVSIGISNMESKTMDYRLAVSIDGKEVKVWPAIDLHSKQQWQATLQLPQITHSSASQVEAMLYQTDNPSKVYRHVELSLGT